MLVKWIFKTHIDFIKTLVDDDFNVPDWGWCSWWRFGWSPHTLRLLCLKFGWTLLSLKQWCGSGALLLPLPLLGKSEDRFPFHASRWLPWKYWWSEKLHVKFFWQDSTNAIFDTAFKIQKKYFFPTIWKNQLIFSGDSLKIVTWKRKQEAEAEAVPLNCFCFLLPLPCDYCEAVSRKKWVDFFEIVEKNIFGLNLEGCNENRICQILSKKFNV